MAAIALRKKAKEGAEPAASGSEAGFTSQVDEITAAIEKITIAACSHGLPWLEKVPAV